MGGVSIWHWVVVGVIVMLLFGRGKVSELMGDMAKGIKAFKKGMADDDTAAATPTTTSAGAPATSDTVRTIEHRTPEAPAATTTGSTFADRKLG